MSRPVVVLALSTAPFAAQEHEHGTTAPEQLGTVNFADLVQRRGAAARSTAPSRCCTRSSSRDADRRVQRHAEDRSVLRDGGLGHRAQPLGQPVRRRHAPAGAAAAGARRRRARARRPARRPSASAPTSTRRRTLYADVETVDQRDAHRRLSRRDGDASPRRIRPTPRRRSSTRCRSPAAPTPTDKTYADQLKAGAILEKLFATAAGSSGPRALHHPQLRRAAARRPRARGGAALREDRAVGAARAAHAVAHVHARRLLAGIDRHQHRVGASRRSADGAIAEELHAIDYQTYAYLQTAQDGAARASLDALPEIAARFDPDAVGSARRRRSAGVFALAAIPARYALERGAWTEAAALEPQPTAVSVHRGADALRPRARRRRIAASTATVRDGDRRAAGRSAIGCAQAKEAYWAEQVEIQRLGGIGVAGARRGADAARRSPRCGRRRSARTRPRRAAVTPGPLAPARELLGEMLLGTATRRRRR